MLMRYENEGVEYEAEAIPMTRGHLPTKRRSNNSLHFPVIYMGRKRFVSDINSADDTLCYLENGNGMKVRIVDLFIIQSVPRRLYSNLKSIQDTEIRLKKSIINLNKVIRDAEDAIRTIEYGLMDLAQQRERIERETK